MNRISLFFLLSIFAFSCKSQFYTSENFNWKIPIGENSWISNNQKKNNNKIIQKEGIRNWDGTKPIHTYFHTSEKGKIKVGFNLKSVPDGAQLQVYLGGTCHKIKLEEKNKTVYAGEFSLEKPGYQQLTLEAVKPTEDGNIEINELLLTGPAAEGDVNFVTDNFHFGRRGPSIHLRYPIPEESKKPVYFYNEIIVPEGDDVIGSYYMANGFAHGYFGIQVNSNQERRILFSVWSPYNTQDPSEIPKDQKIVLLDKGQDVYSGEFGNEGSGGQSYKKYMWKAGTTYKFLLKGEPWGEKHTDYSAYFYVPEKNKWELIASFRRPKSSTYLKNLYSFLENFVPETGDITRKALYKNQWVYDLEQGWIEITDAIFTADATANQKDRLDYAGWEDKEGYYLKNCGFFDNYTQVNSKFKRDKKMSPPQIDFTKLKN